MSPLNRRLCAVAVGLAGFIFAALVGNTPATCIAFILGYSWFPLLWGCPRNMEDPK